MLISFNLVLVLTFPLQSLRYDGWKKSFIKAAVDREIFEAKGTKEEPSAMQNRAEQKKTGMMR